MCRKFIMLSCFVFVLGLAANSARALDWVWREAESADVLGENWRIYGLPEEPDPNTPIDPNSIIDPNTPVDPNALVDPNLPEEPNAPTEPPVVYIGSENGDGNDNDTAPGPEWIAAYDFEVTGGVYKVVTRVIAPNGNDDSFWVRITTATAQNYEDPDQAGTGWVRFNSIAHSDDWLWDDVHSNDHGNAVVYWTLPPGLNTLEIAKREDGTMIDGFVITNLLDLDATALPDEIVAPDIWPAGVPTPADGATEISPMPVINTFVSSDVPKGVPQAYGNIPKGVNSALHVDDSIKIKDLNVELDITMPGNDGDLNVYLTSPDGKKVELFTDIGLYEHNFKNTILDDEASKSIRNGSGPYRGIFKPEGKLSDFDGRNTSGSWILRIEDDWNKVSGATDTATLNSWRIVVKNPITVSWITGFGVDSQDVYFSDNFDDVNNRVTLLGNVGANVDTIDVGSLDYNKTYYFAVDTIAADGTVSPGKVWSFSTPTGNLVIDQRVSGSSDDAEERVLLNNGSMADLASNDLELGYGNDSGDPNHLQTVGCRWMDVALPADSAVLEAYVQFSADDLANPRHKDPANLVIQGELSPDAATFTSDDGNITSRSTTGNAVSWKVPQWMTTHEQGLDERTPDISNIIDEIIGQNGWAEGNALALIFMNDLSDLTTGTRAAESYDGNADEAPLLHVAALVETAMNPSPADGTTDKVPETILSWTPGPSGVSRDVYFGTSSNPPKLERTTGTTWDVGKLAVSTTYYWKIDEYDADGNKHEGKVWSFTTVIGVATNPEPADGSEELGLDTTLSWTPGGTAVSSDVYFGVGNDLKFMGNQTETTFDPNGLKIGRPYSWRIDSIEADGTKHVGEVWHFSTINTGRTSNPDPADGGSVEYVATTLSWTGGPTAASYDVYISENKDDVVAGANAAFAVNVTDTKVIVGLKGTPIPDGLQGKTLYWRVDAVEADREWVHVGEVWSFTVPPFEAYEPSPADGAEDVDPNSTLSWTPGLGAILHEIYFGDDLDTVTNATGASPVPLATFEPGPLEPGKTYYWRVDELTAGFTTTGKVWSFTTTPPPPEPEPAPEPEPEPEPGT